MLSYCVWSHTAQVTKWSSCRSYRTKWCADAWKVNDCSHRWRSLVYVEHILRRLSSWMSVPEFLLWSQNEIDIFPFLRGFGMSAWDAIVIYAEGKVSVYRTFTLCACCNMTVVFVIIDSCACSDAVIDLDQCERSLDCAHHAKSIIDWSHRGKFSIELCILQMCPGLT